MADSSTVLSDLEQTPAPPSTSGSHVSQPTTRNRLLMQLLAGNSSPDVSAGVSATSAPTSKSVTALMPTQTSQSVSSMAQSGYAVASNELSDDLNSVNVTDLLDVPDLLASVNQNCNTSKSDVEDQLLMAHLEQAIMNSELSLEDLDHLLAVSSTPDTTAPVTLSSDNTLAVTTIANSQHQSPPHGNLASFSLLHSLCQI